MTTFALPLNIGVENARDYRATQMKVEFGVLFWARWKERHRPRSDGTGSWKNLALPDKVDDRIVQVIQQHQGDNRKRAILRDFASLVKRNFHARDAIKV